MARDESTATVEWRHKLLEWLAVAAFALATIAFPVITAQVISVSQPIWIGYVATLYVLLSAAAFARRLPYAVRAVSLLSALGLFALFGFLRVGYQVGPGTGCAGIVILSGLLLGRRAMLITFLLTLAEFPAVGLYTQLSHGAFLAPNINDATKLANWVRIAAVYALFAGVLAAAVSFVVDHVERLLRQRTLALEHLRAASLLKRKAEHALDDAQRTIFQMQKLEAVGQLAGGVAHDFNNALVVILGYAELLREESQPDTSMHRGLLEIIRAGNHAAGLTRQLLSFGRRTVSVPRPVAPAQLFDEVEGMLRHVLPAHIQLNASVDAELPAVFVDPGGLQQVLLNLCMNARDAMPDGGKLTLRAQHVKNPDGTLPKGSWVELSVRDTGCGMDEHTLTHAFEPFFTTKGEHGSGLGLSSVYGIITQNGGHVSITSEPGRGSVFTMLLPQCAHESQCVQPIAAMPNVRPSTILVAEDETPVRELIKSVFRSAGHTVLAAQSGSEALAIAQQHSGDIDLLCTDCVMPGQIGSRQLIETFRTMFPNGRVLVCSGHAGDLLLDAGLLSQVGYLQKPFTVETLLRSAGEALSAEAAQA